MKTLLVLAAVGVVILLAWLLKRKSTQAKASNPQAPLHAIQQDVLPERQPEASEIAAPEPVIVSIATLEKASVENKPEEQSLTLESSQAARVEVIPEDSVLRRHYFSDLEAERLVITHPYPTDSVLRRHYESGLLWQLKPVTYRAGNCELITAVEETESGVSGTDFVSKIIIPEDSTLKRHFLTQIQAEVESNLSPRPSDSTLRRHFDSLVKSRVDDYLTTIAA